MRLYDRTNWQSVEEQREKEKNWKGKLDEILASARYFAIRCNREISRFVSYFARGIDRLPANDIKVLNHSFAPAPPRLHSTSKNRSGLFSFFLFFFLSLLFFFARRNTDIIQSAFLAFSRLFDKQWNVDFEVETFGQRKEAKFSSPSGEC